MGVERTFLVDLTTVASPPVIPHEEEIKSTHSAQPQAWEQAPLQLSTGASSSSSSTPRRIRILSAAPMLRLDERNSLEESSIHFRTRYGGTISKRANIEEAGKTSNSTTDQPPTRTLQVSPSLETIRRKTSARHQGAATKPPTNQQLAPVDNGTTPAVSPTTTNPHPPTPKNPVTQNSSAPLNNPTAEPERKTSPITPVPVAPTTPAPEVKPIAVQRETSAAAGGGVPASSPPNGATPTTPTLPNETKLSPPPPSPPRGETPAAPPAPQAPSAHAHPAGQRSVDSGQLTSIAVGVACAASLLLMVVGVVIFKIRVSRKKALNRLSRFEGHDFFRAPDRQSLSASNSSQNSVYVVPRPAGPGFGPHPETQPVRPPFAASNYAGIGTQPPQAYQPAAPQHLASVPYPSPPYLNPPPRPPRSPLRLETFQKPENSYQPSGWASGVPGGAPSEGSPTHPTGGPPSKEKEKPTHELRSFQDYQYSDAVDYLDHYYLQGTSHPASTYSPPTRIPHNLAPPVPHPPLLQNPLQFVGLNPMQLDDRPYDHRYTVDRNGVLNNLAHSAPPISPGTDYYYKKRPA